VEEANGVGLLAVNHDPASAAYVRRYIADDLARRSVSRDCIDDVVLVASELVGNAITHAPAPVDHELDVSWDLEPDAVVVRVLDGSRDLPHRQPRDTSHTGGRGLSIVAAIALDWGVRRTELGKQVWARVPIARAV
jgi:anti-sigma regulatory factor (Ser/Thr protein kinase)